MVHGSLKLLFPDLYPGSVMVQIIQEVLFINFITLLSHPAERGKTAIHRHHDAVYKL